MSQKDVEKTHPFFRDTRVDTCNNIKLVNGKAVAVSFKNDLKLDAILKPHVAKSAIKLH